MGSLRVGHNWVTLLSLFTFMHWRRKWQPIPVFLPGESHGQRSLEGYSPWGLEESDTTERLHFHFSLSCIGEGNDNPLQCYCLENPRDGGAWWAAVYGVGQSQTQLKRLSSSSSSVIRCTENTMICHWLSQRRKSPRLKSNELSYIPSSEQATHSFAHFVFKSKLSSLIFQLFSWHFLFLILFSCWEGKKNLSSSPLG